MTRHQRHDRKRSGTWNRMWKERHRGWVRRMIKAGRLVRKLACEECGASSPHTAFHHYEYGEPELVKELCPKCHRAKHPRKLPQGGVA